MGRRPRTQAHADFQSVPVVRPQLLLLERTDNLPSHVSSFVGRQREIAELRHLLINSRLLTLTGGGGIGKTRLALAMAEAVLPDYSDGVWLVELAPVSEGALVPGTVAAAFGIRQSGSRVFDHLVDVLRSKAMLLLLDNCEQVVHACAELVEALLRSCRDVQIVTTSREPLHVVGEVIFPVLGMALPDPAEPHTSHTPRETEAIRLFVERATAVAPGFRLNEHNAAAVISVCRQLDGIPLAIELAAARTKVLAPAQIAERLVDRFHLLTDGGRTAPVRQRTLHATFDWSYDLLSEQEQRLFERLSVFAGGWTLEAAEAVCTDEALSVHELLELLARLVDKSLVVVESEPAATARYRYLDTVRDYAMEKLSRRGELANIKERHAAFCLALGNRSESLNLTPRQAESLSLLQPDHENLLAALGWLVERGANETAQRLGSLAWRLWLYSGLFAEGEAWLNRLLALPGGEGTPARVILLHGAALIARHSGNYGASSVLAEASLTEARTMGDLAAESFSLYILGSNARFTGQWLDAERLYRAGIQAGQAAVQHPGPVYPRRYAEYSELICLEGLLTMTPEHNREASRTGLEEVRERAMKSGYARVAGEASGMLGSLRYVQGDYPAARAFFEESLTVAQSIGDSSSCSYALTMLGVVSLHTLEFDRAHALLVDGLRRANGAGMRRNIVDSLAGFACLAALSGQSERALWLAGAAHALSARLGTPESRTQLALWHRFVAPVCHTFGPARAKSELAHGRQRSFDQAIVEALKVEIPEAHTVGGPKLPGVALSPRELEVVGLIARGYNNRRIAEELVIALSTAERHVANILAKLGLASRTQVATWALERHALPAQGRPTQGR
jgi:predicted ATPase/DNA-binding CsgD family transcriptional regulator